MRSFTPLFVITALLLAAASPSFAQTAVDPTGHWEGTVRAPEMELKIEVDITKNSKGQLSGIFGQPAQGVKGLPLSTVTLDGRSLRFIVKADAEPATFDGVVSNDGVSMAGKVSGKAANADYSVPFTLTRNGDARIPPVPKSAPIGKELEGTWNGALNLGARQMRVMVKMANQPDGTATGTVVSVDGSGVKIPIAITQNGSSVTIDVAQVGASFAGVLNDAQTELSGTWTQQGTSLPLTLRRAAK